MLLDIALGESESLRSPDSEEYESNLRLHVSWLGTTSQSNPVTGVYDLSTHMKAI